MYMVGSADIILGGRLSVSGCRSYSYILGHADEQAVSHFLALLVFGECRQWEVEGHEHIGAV